VFFIGLLGAAEDFKKRLPKKFAFFILVLDKSNLEKKFEPS